MTDRDSLILSMSKRVQAVAEKMSRRTRGMAEADDLYSEGMIGVMDAAKRFDPKRGFVFRTLAERRASGAMLDYLRRLDWYPRTQRQKVRAGRAEEPRFEPLPEFTSVESRDEAIGVEAERKDSIREFFRRFGREDTFIVLSGVVLGLSQSDIGKAVGLSQSDVSYRWGSLLERLRARDPGILMAAS